MLFDYRHWSVNGKFYWQRLCVKHETCYAIWNKWIEFNWFFLRLGYRVSVEVMMDQCIKMGFGSLWQVGLTLFLPFETSNPPPPLLLLLLLPPPPQARTPPMDQTGFCHVGPVCVCVCVCVRNDTLALASVYTYVPAPLWDPEDTFWQVVPTSLAKTGCPPPLRAQKRESRFLLNLISKTCRRGLADSIIKVWHFKVCQKRRSWGVNSYWFWILSGQSHIDG